MNEFDFTECRFIKEELRFLFYNQFVKDCFIIKRGYNKLSNNGKIFYKYYVYAGINTTLGQKNAIWEFLNNEGMDYYNNLVAIQKGKQ